MTAVKGVFLVGDPEHKSGLTCNVDVNGGTTTLNVNGVSYRSGSIPTAWVPKSLDVCAFVSALVLYHGCSMLIDQGDGICDTTDGSGINQAHLSYPSSQPTQNLGTTWIEGKLQGTS